MTALVVVGDVMLDVDIIGSVRRLTPDAPVPVLETETEHSRPGGAALAAELAPADSVTLIAPVPDDSAGQQLRRLLPDRIRLIALPCEGSTSVKTRLLAGERSLARLDRGGDRNQVLAVPDAARAALAQADAVLVADYGRGTTDSPELRALLAETARRAPLVWDPHPRGREPVPGTLVATPNQHELAGFIGQKPSDQIDKVTAQARQLRERWRLPWLVTTLGRRGALLHGGGQPYLVAAEPATGDSCGAGDAFAAALASALSTGALPSEACEQAVTAAADYVRFGRRGAVPPTATTEPLEAMLSRVRRTRGTVVATGGCFDLLHPGHVAVLESARAWGDCLVVCLNSDASVRRLKGPDRPVQNEHDRAAVLAALRCVDAVLIFEQDTPEQALRQLRPDLWVKGGDYAGLELPEAAVLAEWGGVTATVPYAPGRSTTELLRRARAG